jgi:hypothetical protein
MFIRSLFLSPDGDPATVTPKPRVSSAETFIARYGSAEAAVAVLLQELDASNRTAEGHARVIEEQKKQIPGADKVVLEKKDADELTAFRALKLAPEKITEVISERDTLKGTVAAAALAVQAREGASAAGLDPDGWAAHVARAGLVQEMRDVQVVDKGKTVTKKVPHVRPGNDEKAPFVPASDYVAKLPAYEQRALSATAVAPTPTTTAQPYPNQQPTPASGSAGDKAGEFLNQFNERGKAKPNPLIHRPAPQPAAATT